MTRMIASVMSICSFSGAMLQSGRPLRLGTRATVVPDLSGYAFSSGNRRSVVLVSRTVGEGRSRACHPFADHAIAASLDARRRHRRALDVASARTAWTDAPRVHHPGHENSRG